MFQRESERLFIVKICCRINECTGSEWMGRGQMDGRVDGEWEDEGIYGWTDG